MQSEGREMPGFLWLCRLLRGEVHLRDPGTLWPLSASPSGKDRRVHEVCPGVARGQGSSAEDSSPQPFATGD